MIHLDSYGTSLAFDAATPEGLAEWDQLEHDLRDRQTSLPLPTRPLSINATAPLPRRPIRAKPSCRTVAIQSDLKRLADELQQVIALLGS